MSTNSREPKHSTGEDRVSEAESGPQKFKQNVRNIYELAVGPKNMRHRNRKRTLENEKKTDFLT